MKGSGQRLAGHLCVFPDQLPVILPPAVGPLLPALRPLRLL
jgi:hypothetical protein